VKNNTIIRDVIETEQCERDRGGRAGGEEITKNNVSESFAPLRRDDGRMG